MTGDLITDPPTAANLKDVRILLMLKNIRQNQLAKKYNLNKSVLNLVINRKRKTLHVRRIIAQELELDYKEVWGA